MDTGWIKLHRKLLDNDVFMHDKNAKLLFIDLLLLAKKSTGTFDTGRYQLSEITGIKPMTVYKALVRLEIAGMITLSSNNRYTRINICKWKEYQGGGNNLGNNTVTSGEHPGNIQVTLNKKEEYRKKNTTNVVSAERYGKPELNDLFDYWAEKVGVEIHSRTKSNRNAANNLFKKHGEAKVKQLIDGVAMTLDDRYAPRISDFCDLQSKLNDLLLWGRKRGSKVGLEVIA